MPTSTDVLIVSVSRGGCWTLHTRMHEDVLGGFVFVTREEWDALLETPRAGCAACGMD